MATHITQIDDIANNRTVLRIDGEMRLDDALLLEKITAEIARNSDAELVIDLAELDLLDSDAAPVLKRLQDRNACRIEGVELFVQAAVNESERVRR
jgi:anti-anti-sigma regulatory factor